MKKYLVETNVIPTNRIVIENRSLTTIENIKNMKAILQQYDYTSLTIISSKWHMPRVKYICNMFNLPTNKTTLSYISTIEEVSKKRILLEKKYLEKLKIFDKST